MTYQNILSDLKKGNYKPIYFLHGEEAYYIDAITKYIEEHALTDAEKAFNQVVLYGKEIDFKNVVDNARQFPMMASRRVVIVKEAKDMRSMDKLVSYFEKPSDQTVLVIAHKHKKIDGRSKLAKVIKKNAVVFESSPVRDYKIAEWISSYVSKEGFKIDGKSCILLGEYLGTDLSKITNEIAKLTLNLEKGSTIDANLIHEKIEISKDFNIFELQNALGKRDTAKSFLITDYFSNNIKKHPLVMLNGSLYNYFVKVMLTAVNINKSDQEIASRIKLPNAFFVKDYKVAARNYKLSSLVQIFAFIKEADARSKGMGNRSTPPEAILTELVYKILNAA